ncbi:MAG: hypothetical protein ACLTGQ_09195 [Mediterraneibacter gnavus]
MEKTEENLVQNNNIQRHAFQVTINNPLEHGFDHLENQKDISRELYDTPLLLHGRRDRKRGNATYPYLCVFYITCPFFYG